MFVDHLDLPFMYLAHFNWIVYLFFCPFVRTYWCKRLLNFVLHLKILIFSFKYFFHNLSLSIIFCLNVCIVKFVFFFFFIAPQLPLLIKKFSSSPRVFSLGQYCFILSHLSLFNFGFIIYYTITVNILELKELFPDPFYKVKTFLFFKEPQIYPFVTLFLCIMDFF